MVEFVQEVLNHVLVLQDGAVDRGVRDVAGLVVNEIVSGINDTWKIVNIEKYPSAIVSVYNRSGNKVFNAQGYSNDWNGVYRDRSERF